MQIFSRSPQRWREHALDLQEAAEFRRRCRQQGIELLFIHIPYLINLASPSPRLYEASIRAYIEDVKDAALLGADYIVTHMGSHKKTSEEAGLERYTAALARILRETRGARVGILLENTAGSGSWLGYTFAHHRRIIQGVKYSRRVGVCLDTAHAYLAGYALDTKAGLERLVSDIEKHVGINRLRLIHLNDAAGTCGSRHDRHEHIGSGGIGREGIRRIINHPGLRDLPFILETPRENERAHQLDLGRVRALRFGLRPFKRR